MTYSIGICDGHGGSCAIAQDNKIIYAASEERYSRVKNDGGFPLKALEFGLKSLNIHPSEVEKLTFSQKDRSDFLTYEYRVDALLSVEDHFELMDKFWHPRLTGMPYDRELRYKLASKSKHFKEKGFFGIPREAILENKDNNFFVKKAKDAVESYFQIPSEKIHFVDHHSCHALYATATTQIPNREDFAVVTVDSWGDGKNQTVWKGNHEALQLVAESSSCLLARIYRFTTLYLGMRPNEHEYKVMGLSAYANDNYIGNIHEQLSELINVCDMTITAGRKVPDLFEELSNIYRRQRFDNIAGAVQLLVENALIKLFENISKELCVKEFYYAGGVAMNVKANKRIMELSCINKLIVPGAPDDQSVAIGAALHPVTEELKPCFGSVKNMYLGESVSGKKSDELKTLCASDYPESKVCVRDSITPHEAAQLIVSGKILGRVSGRMEFGARALGNRSIFALPDSWDNVDQINHMIKGRDFWMPFAGAMLDIDAEVVLGKAFQKSDGRFMTIAFDTNDIAASEIKAATHRRDKTIRAQICKKDDNPWLYEMLLAIKKEREFGVVLNTSFNLHGYPIVANEIEALHVFFNSGLKNLIIGDVLIQKENAG